MWMAWISVYYCMESYVSCHTYLKVCGFFCRKSVDKEINRSKITDNVALAKPLQRNRIARSKGLITGRHKGRPAPQLCCLGDSWPSRRKICRY